MNVSGPASQVSCPYAERVASLRDGLLLPEQVEETEAHLAACPLCGELVDSLDAPSDAITRALSALPGSTDDEPEFQRLQQTLLSLTPGRTGRGGIGRRLADPPIGKLPQTLGNYELLACIGRGAWGAVYRARHRTLDQTLAVKVLDASRWESPEFVERFIQEAKAAGQLNHPLIVRATDAGEDRGFHYLVMEFIEGIDAARLLRRTGPLPIPEACEIVRQAASALHFAHERGWIHRDVKPSNLMISPEGKVKLLDLGIAGRRDEGRGAPNHAAPPLGTAEYMAPEQWANFADVDARADVYSLGCTLFKLLTGRAPLEGSPPPIAGCTDTDGPPPSLAERRRETRGGLDRFARRMLADRPEERVATAAEVAEKLAAWTRRADLQLLVEDAGVFSSAAREEASAHSTPARSGGVRTSRRWLVLGGTVAAAGLAFGLPWLLGERSPELRRYEWRPLAPKPPTVLVAAEEPEAIRVQPDDHAGLSVSSTDLLLVHLGRAVSGKFALQVTLRPETSSNGAGVFFQFRWRDDPPNVCEFQSLELRSDESQSTQTIGRLLWSFCTATIETGELVIHREGWAETDVDLPAGLGAQRLEVLVGRSGFPEVRFNDRLLKTAAWTMSTEGYRQASLAPDEVARRYQGKLGLVNVGGTTAFLSPQLAYL